MRSSFFYFSESFKFLWPAFFLLAGGLLTIYSISVALFWKQLAVSLTGLVLIFLFWKTDWRSVNYKWPIFGFYVLSIILLLFVYLFGPVIRGAKSWFKFGPIYFQPVELAKISLIFIYAGFFSRLHVSVARWKIILNSFLFFIFPAVLVLLQPNLGSCLILFGIWFGFLLISGLPWQRALVVFLILVLAGILGWGHFLKPYQKERIAGLFNPQKNTLGINYQIIQSKIAIGSAGWWGKGYKQGTETELGFLSEAPDDFILSAFVEEWGIVAGILLIIVFLFLIFKILSIALKSGDNFEKFIALGTAIVFGAQFSINSGSAVGIFPVVGLTFPFLSYGGSSLLVNFFLLAVLNAIKLRQLR